MKKKLYSTRLMFLFSISCLLYLNTSALNYYWVGGTGKWSDYSSHWATSSGGNVFHVQVPQSVDNVFFDANSFTAPNQVVTIDSTIVNCHDMVWMDQTNNPTLAGLSSRTLKIFGTLTFHRGMNLTFAGPVHFEAITTGHKITMAGKIFAEDVSFNGIGGEWQLQDSFSTTSNSGIYLNNGTLLTNNQVVSSNEFESRSGNTRALIMGSSVFNLSNITSFWTVTAAGLTLNSGTSTINSTNNQAGWSPTLAGAGLVYYDVNFLGTLTKTGSITGGNTFHNVTFNSNADIGGKNFFNEALLHKSGLIRDSNTYNTITLTKGYTYTLEANRTQKINTALNVAGDCSGLITMESSVQGTRSNITKASGTVNGTYLNLKDMNAYGGASFIANNSVDLGNNNGWVISPLASQDLYWIGNSGNWSDGNHWSATSGGPPSGCSPTPKDNVFFDANSFSAGSQVVTINVPTAYCNSMNWTGTTNNPSFAGPVGSNLKIYGSLTFVQGMALTFAGPTFFEATDTGKTITSATKIFNNDVTFNGVGGGWKLLDDFTTNLSSGIYLDHGTLVTNNQKVTSNEFESMSGYTRSLIMGSSVFNLNNITSFWTVKAAGIILDAGTSTVNSTNNQAGWTPTFAGGGLTYYDVNFQGTQTKAGSVTGGNVFHNVFFGSAGDISGKNFFNECFMSKDGMMRDSNTYNLLTFTPGYTYTLQSGRTQLINNNLVALGSCGGLIAINASTVGTRATIKKTSGTLTVSYVNFKDISAIGGAVFTANSSIDLGNTVGWTINAAAPKDLFWIGNSGNWDDGSHWATTSGGAPSGCSPTPKDNVFFDLNSFSASGQTVTVNVPTAYCNSMTWTGVTNNPTFTGVVANNLKIYGSLTMVPGMSYTFAGPVFFEATDTGKTVTTGGQIFTEPVTFNGIGGGWKLLDNFTTDPSTAIYLNNGTLNTNGQTVTASEFESRSGLTRALILGNSTLNFNNITTFWAVTAAGITLDAGTSTINSTNNSAGWSPTFAGGGLVYYDLNFKGNLTQTGSINGNNTFHNVVFNSKGDVSNKNIFNDLTFLMDGVMRDTNTCTNLTFTPGYTYTLQAGKMQTILGDLNISGTGGFPVRIQSSLPGTQSTIFKNSGLVCVDFLRLSDNNAAGAATFYAGANSQDLGGNTGWIFTGGGGSGGAAALNLVASPSDSICAGTNVRFTATATNGGAAPTYNWMVNGVSVQSGTSNEFDTDSLKDNDEVSCELVSSAPCLSVMTDTASITMKVVSTMGSVGLTADKTLMCSGDSAEVCAPAGYSSYTWNTGESSQCIFTKVAGNLYVTATNGSGCAASSTPLAINVHPVPSVSISISGDTLTSFNAISYQWYFNNTIIPGATSAMHVATQTGSYQVEITDANGCKTRSSAVTVDVVGINEENAGLLVNIFPNPSNSGAWTVQVPDVMLGNTLQVFDEQGRKVFEQRITANLQVVEINVAKGIYLMRISNEGYIVTRKLVKM